MADFTFPKVSFDWISEIPDLLETSRLRRARAETLADLDPTTATPKQLDEAAAKLLRAGDFETFKTIYGLSTQRREVERKRESDLLYQSALPGILSGMRNLPPGVPGTVPGVSDPFTPAPSTGGYDWGKVPIPSTASGPGPQSRAPSPSDELLNLAQAAIGGGGAPPPGLTRLAQLGPGLPGVSPPSSAGLPPWVAGAAAPAVPAPPPTVPEPAPGLPVQDAARQRVDAIAQIMAGVPPRAPGAIAALRSQMMQALPATKLGQEDINWYTENFDRRAQGLPPIPRSTYKAQEEFRPVEQKAAMEIYTEVGKGMREAQKLRSDIQAIETVVNNPKFESGSGTAFFNYGKGLVRNFMTTLQASGVPLPDEVVAKVNNATAAVPLREALSALTNSSAFAKLGNLGNQTSDSDRNFITAIFPSLQASVEGNKILTEYFKEVTRKNIELERQVRAQYGPKMTPAQLNKTIDDYWSDSNNSILIRDGKPTELGKRLEALAGRETTSSTTEGGPRSGTIFNVPWSFK